MAVVPNYQITDIKLNTFAINNVSTKKIDDLVHFDVAFREQVNAELQIVSIIFRVNIFADEKKSVRIGAIETKCSFKIKNFNDVMHRKELPSRLIASLLDISINTTRGVLLTKCSETILNGFVLPLIDPVELVKDSRTTLTIDDLIEKGNNYLQLGNFKKALHLYTKALNIDPKSFEAIFNRAVTYSIMGKYKKAINDYSKCIYYYPEYVQAYNNRGYIFTTIDEKQKALKDFDKAIKEKPDFAEAYLGRGALYFLEDEIDKALSDFNKAIELKPDYSNAYNNRATLFADKLQQPDKALADYNKAIELNPYNYDAYFGKGVLFANMNDLQAAIENLTIAIDIFPQFYQAYTSRASFYRKMQKYDTAIKDAQSAMEIHPKDPLAYAVLAEIYADKNETEMFYKNLDEALKKGFEPEDFDNELLSKYKYQERYQEIVKTHKTSKNNK